MVKCGVEEEVSVTTLPFGISYRGEEKRKSSILLTTLRQKYKGVKHYKGVTAEMSFNFDWAPFYTELADALLPYKDDRSALVTKVKKIYEITKIKFPTLDQEGCFSDIDPFTFYGLFNKQITNKNRIDIIKAIADLFDIKAVVPTSFEGIPVLNNLNATYYGFAGDRKDDDIDKIWDLFKAGLDYAKDMSQANRAVLIGAFDTVMQKIYGSGNSKITMGLFWIAPEVFLSLDQRNVWYIYESGKLPPDFVNTLPKADHKISAEKYLEITEKTRGYVNSTSSKFKNFKELSYESWMYSEEVNEQLNEDKKNKTNRENVGEAVADKGVETVHYWLYSPGDSAMYWDEFYSSGIMAIGWDNVGDLSVFNTKDEMKQKMKETIDPTKPYKNAAHATWQFANEIKPGDVVFAKKGMYTIVGRGVVESDYQYDAERPFFRNVRKVKWTHKGEWDFPGPGQAAMKTLTDITPYSDNVEKLNDLFISDTEEDIEEVPGTELNPYDADKFLEEVYMDRKQYDTLVAIVKKKKNVILQGAPGVGKTYAAKRLAYSIMGVKDPERVMMVQFHQSYSYEDFIMGFRPTQEGGFELKHGAFYEFCKSAEVDSDDTPYFFIIDEINRGNLSKIFGELFMLVEADKRGIGLKLLYADEKFSIPKNVYLIGMMNTADRSLAMMDYALRRRFAFFTMEPGFETEGFKQYRDGLNSEKFNKLVDCVENLNDVILQDESLGEGFRIGHSYFCNLEETSDQTLSGIVEYELVPLLKEYWFEEPAKARTWIENLRSAIK